jgi:hypothetical protein
VTVLGRHLYVDRRTAVDAAEEVDMQFAVLIYQDWTWIDGLQENSGMAEPELAEIGKEYAEIAATPGFQQNIPFGHPKDATTVRVQDGNTIASEGTVGGLSAAAGSVYVFEAEDKTAAIEFASRIPAARLGGAIEVRPIGQYW